MRHAGWVLLLLASFVPQRAQATRPVSMEAGRVVGSVRGMARMEAVRAIADAAGARLVWAGSAALDAVSAEVEGLPLERALGRVLGGRSFMAELGRAGVIRVFSADLDTSVHEVGLTPHSEDDAALPGAGSDHLEGSLRGLRQMAELEQQLGSTVGDAEVGERLALAARGSAIPELRLVAAERLVDIDPERARATLVQLTADPDATVRVRAEALLAALP